MDVHVVVVHGAEKPVSYRLENGVLEVWMGTEGAPPAVQQAEETEGNHWLYLYEQNGRRHHPGEERMQRPARGRMQPL